LHDAAPPAGNVASREPFAAAPRSARLVRLRVRGRPGSLAAVAGHLADHGVDGIRLEVLNREAGWAIDDLLVRERQLDEALAGFGPHATVLARPRSSLPGRVRAWRRSTS
jgi:hypothetical protein